MRDGDERREGSNPTHRCTDDARRLPCGALVAARAAAGAHRGRRRRVRARGARVVRGRAGQAVAAGGAGLAAGLRRNVLVGTARTGHARRAAGVRRILAGGARRTRRRPCQRIKIKQSSLRRQSQIQKRNTLHWYYYPQTRQNLHS